MPDLVEKESSSARDPRRDFLHRFFHDLATPLSAAALHLESAERRVKRGADPSGSLEVARRELSRAFELFDLGRDCLIGPEESEESFSFDDLVASALRASPAPDIAVQGSTSGRVKGTRRTLEQALAGLVANAVEASGPDAIGIRVERRGAHLRAVVESPGPLSEGEPESFFSPRAARPGRLWGMGLPRARLSAAGAGGTVTLERTTDGVLAILELPEENN